MLELSHICGLQRKECSKNVLETEKFILIKVAMSEFYIKARFLKLSKTVTCQDRHDAGLRKVPNSSKCFLECNCSIVGEVYLEAVDTLPSWY